MRILVIAALLISGYAAATDAGFQIESFVDADRKRPILIDWWYPVEGQSASSYNYGLGRGRVVESGTIAPGVFPLIVLSHGAFGAARNYSWIAEVLARNGFMVAGISHFGESYVYGAETVDPTSVLRSWERALDVSAAISHIKKHSTFTLSVDSKRIGFIGHSSGGATAMSLAGVRFEGHRIAEYCLSPESMEDRGCDYGRSETNAVSADRVQSVVEDYADPRIRVFVALDPALGPGFFDYSSVDPDMGMLIVGSVDNDFLPFRYHAERFAEDFPNAESHWLTGGEGHFVYLNECDLSIDANGVPLCKDRAGVDRGVVHKSLGDLVLRFLNQSFGLP